VPAAHPDIKRTVEGYLECLGYLIKFKGKKIYHSGDTSVNKELIEELKQEKHIDIAFISVNEKNYYRDEMGIIGNMSVREAFHMAEDISAKVVVPMHWDMFKQNCVYREEIELLYQKIKPNFELKIRPEYI
jgi:L-ascorbate metabolism protein UlaG (beta-lactamase superfamily)